MRLALALALALAATADDLRALWLSPREPPAAVIPRRARAACDAQPAHRWHARGPADALRYAELLPPGHQVQLRGGFALVGPYRDCAHGEPALVWATVEPAAAARCNASANPLNAALPDRCRCAPTHAGDRCQFAKTDHCCGPAPCPFRDPALRLASQAHRRAWCGGHPFAPCTSSNHQPPVCQCPPAYEGPRCEQSACGRSCNEAGAAAAGAPGLCVAGRGPPRCECDHRFPRFAFAASGCAESREWPSPLLARCGLRLDESRLSASRWGPECGGRGLCDPAAGGCVCFDPADDPSRLCEPRPCGQCAVGGTRECGAGGVCVCHEGYGGGACEVDLCALTQGRREGPACECPSGSEWTPAGCAVPALRDCGRGVVPRALDRRVLAGASPEELFLAQCRCYEASEPLVQVTEPGPRYGRCEAACPEEYAWHPPSGQCCHKLRVGECGPRTEL